MIRITEIKIELKDALTKDKEQASIEQYLLDKYRILKQDIRTFSIYKKAIDARKKDHVIFVYSVDITVPYEKKLIDKKYPNLSVAPDISYHEVEMGDEPLKHRPIVIGFGPSGIFSALLLARRGYKPIVLERGLDVDQRTALWEDFKKTGKFHEHATILFGEGGAGTFSDGKLTTLINDLRSRYVLEALVKHGADESILYINKPHVGTDILKGIIKNIRKEITQLGGEVRFNQKVTAFEIDGKELKAVIVNDKDRIPTDLALLGIGHSARDLFTTLYEQGIQIAQKAFSIGVRIEHPQKLINESQFGKFSTMPNLGAADYKLSYKSPNGRGAYTFCMCPGGYVMCSASEPNGVVTNGMSESKRDGENANAALLVNVMPEDFKSDHPLAGMYFQREFEQNAFKLAGGGYKAPLQLVKDFLNNEVSTQIGSVKPTYEPGYTFVNFKAFFPEFIHQTLHEAILDFDRKIKGFAMDDAIMTGVESRSSSPIRINRDETGQSNILGLYPMGEGAGHAGGIMSSAIDGLKQAELVIKKYAKNQ
ncbi:hypothetical protein N7603_07425 [Acholeplasma vituli]|uniref:FAD-dependent protein C-terminal domain-containing protein n=1 Tax=Paracholeplasma vituli TaxID=69473 RepID=A0ABT2PX07_9MOLU|nr:hypothetical protein [Paracholeplasma vituli]MCU0105486.1 hypothetical protein [Paracholeplasma vituli]